MDMPTQVEFFGVIIDLKHFLYNKYIPNNKVFIALPLFVFFTLNINWIALHLRVYTFFNLTSSFFFCNRVTIVTRNLLLFTYKHSFFKRVSNCRKFKQRNAFLLNTDRIQVRATFSFVRRNFRKHSIVGSNACSGWVWNYKSINLLKSFGTRKRKNKLVYFKRQHRTLVQSFFSKTRRSLTLKILRRNSLVRLLKQFKCRGYRQLTSFFSMSVFKLISRIFCFFDRFFLYKLVNLGLFFINFRPLKARQYALVAGDFVNLSIIEEFNFIYQRWIRYQRAYTRFLYKNLFQYFRSQFRNAGTKNFLYYSTLYSNLYKAIPSWVEVSFLSLSFFVVKEPRLVSFRSYNFNPFLYRLLLL